MSASIVVDLSGKTALVTGASRGIGAAIAKALAARGARVLLVARSEPNLLQTAEAIRATGGQVDLFPCDLAQPGSAAELFKHVDANEYGLDILINNAGRFKAGQVQSFELAALDQLYALNVRAAFGCAQEALKRMALKRAGWIINVSSVVGYKGYENQAGYTATKHALMGFTKVLAKEAQAHGVRVSVIAPGGVDTEMVGDARPDLDRAVLLQPEDVAHCVLFLLSLPPRAMVDEIYLRRAASTPF